MRRLKGRRCGTQVQWRGLEVQWRDPCVGMCRKNAHAGQVTMVWGGCPFGGRCHASEGCPCGAGDVCLRDAGASKGAHAGQWWGSVRGCPCRAVDM